MSHAGRGGRKIANAPEGKRSIAAESRAFPLSHALWIFAIAVVARVAHLLVSTRADLYDGLFLDGKYYADVAASIRLGHGAGDHPYLLSPLYPYFLACFTDARAQLDVLFVRCVQSLLGAATAVIAAWIAARVVEGARSHADDSTNIQASPRAARARAAAWIAGIVAALHGPTLHMESTVLVSSLSSFCLTSAVALMLAFDVDASAGRRNAARCRLAAAGLTLGLASALHATALAIVATFSVLLCVRRALPACPRITWIQRTSETALFLAAVVIPIVPFTVRNMREGNEAVLLSANGGMNFWIGNGAGATGLFRTPPEYQFASDPVAKVVAERESGGTLSYTEASRWWSARAWTEIRAAPATWLALLARKAALFFHPMEIPQLGESFSWFRDRAWTLRFAIDARLLLLLAFLAPLLLWKARGARALADISWPFVALCVHALVIVGFFVTGRYRAPILPIASALAGVALVEAWALFPRWARERGAHAWGAVAACAACLVASHWLYSSPSAPLALHAPLVVELRHEGMRLYDAGRYAEAVDVYQRVLESKDDPVTRTNLANALKALGRYTEAEAQYRLALAASPRDGVTWYNLGNLLRRQMKDSRAAKEAYERSIDCAPSFAEAHFNLGAVLLDLQEPGDAAVSIEAALQLASPTAPWRKNAEEALTIARTRAAQEASETR